jgi:arylsulfatase A-like enzyme
VPALQRVAPLQAALFALAWLLSAARFALAAEDLPARFTALARGPYLSTAFAGQLALLPGYAFLALVATLLVAPWVGSPVTRLQLLLRVLALDAALALLSLGPALRRGPGLFDTVARKLPQLDVYALQRAHVLEGLSVLFALALVLTLARAFGRRGLAGAVVIALLAAAVARVPRAPPRASKRERPNVLVLATDSLRFDRLGVHGAAHPDITPHLDAFAQRATDFTNLHVATASTLEAWVTLLLGQLPATHGVRSMYPSRDEVRAVEAQPAALPRLLTAAGYDTFVSSDWAGNCFDLVDLGFARRHVAPVQNFEALLSEASLRAHPLVPLFLGVLPAPLADALVPGRAALASLTRPEVLVDQLFDEVDRSVRAERPFFGVLFASPTHLPYNARYPFNVKYGDPAYRGPHRFQVEVSAHELITTGFSPALSPEVIAHVRDLYDGAVSDFDDTVGQVLRELEARGLGEDTVVIVTTDHGEDLYEPGSTLGHGTNFFGGDQSTRIPFLLRLPGQRSAGKVEALTRTVDVAPTLLALLGLPVPASMEGVDLSPALRGAHEEAGLVAYAETCYLFFPKAKAMTVLSEAERAEVVELAGAADTLEVDPGFRHNLVIAPKYRAQVIAAKDRMVRTARWKLVEIPGKTRPIRRLYDVVEDPLQRRDLAGQGLAVEEELAALLARRDCRARHP